MQINERINYIKKQLSERKIDENTQNYIVRYVQMNQELFGNVINMDKLTKRLMNNMQHSISTQNDGYNVLLQMTLLLSQSGNWDAYKKRIYVSPFYKIGSRISKRFVQSRDSTIFHELDHCATTEYEDITEQEIYDKYNGIKHRSQ